MTFRKILSFSAAFLTLASTSSFAAQPRFLQAYGDWDTHVYTENGNKVCFMSSRPKKSEGNYSKRGEVFAYVTHFTGDNANNVFGFVAGYNYKTGSEVSVNFGNNKETLFTQGDKAWGLDSRTDENITKMIKAKNSMIIRGVSSRGTRTKDTFSLRGSTKAYQRISKECGVQ